MVSAVCVTLTVLLQCILCYSPVSSFKVELSPKKPLFRVGDRQELTCRTSKCSDKMTFSWSNLEDKPLYAEPQTSSTESTLVFKSVSKNNENKIQCKATCLGMIKQAAVQVRVYSFPKVPVISGHDRLVLGKENSLTCEVSDVYPAEHMTVEWLRGGKVVHTQEGEYGIESIQSYYTFTPQTNDGGESITCRATLSLDGLPPEERTREITVTMAVLFSSFKVELSPKKPLFRVGDRQELTCRMTKCSDKMTFSWSNLEDKPLYAEPQTSSTESTLVFKSVSKNNENKIQCKATCLGMIKQAAVQVRVYSFPKVPVISGHDSLVLGKENNLTCEVSDVYPAEHMTVEWLRGGKVVHTQEGEYGIESIQSYYTFTPQTNDDGESITCRATLSLDGLPPEERTREITVSMAVLFSSFKVELSPKKPLFRVGDRQELTCRMTKCSDKMTFSWSNLEDKPLYAEPQTSSTESTLVFKSVSKNNENKIQCKATCLGMIKQAAVQVRVYSFPKVPVISGHDSLVLGKENNLTCEVSDVYPAEHMTVEWLRGGKVVHTQEGEYGIESIQSYYTFTPQTNDDGESITCRATLSLDGLPTEERTREITVSMAVLSFPKVPVISGHDSLVLGKENSLTCEVSDVYPAENMTVEWLRGGKVVHTQEGEYGIESIQSYYTFTPQTNDDGESITCRATLSLDGLPPEERTRETTVTMAVLSPPRNTTMKNTKDDGNVYTALLRRLNSIDVIIPVVGMGVLASVASSLNCVRKAARKGLSCLNKGTPETV